MVCLVSLVVARHGAGERLLVYPVHAHGAEDGLRTDGAPRSPRSPPPHHTRYLWGGCWRVLTPGVHE